VRGKHLLVDGDRLRRYTGLIPKISPAAVLSIAWSQARTDRRAKKVPVDAPWDARRAQEWDAQTVADHLGRSGIRTQIGRDLYEMAVRGLFTGDLADTSYLHLLWLVRAHHSLNNLFSIEKGSQENLVVGGAGTMAARMADQLGASVRRSAPVRRVAQTADRVTVEAEGVTVVARHAIVTAPPALVLEIDFDPVLPPDRLELYRAAVAGPESKTLVVYDEPFWRGEGWSGQSAGPHSAAEVTLDASPVTGTPGVLASFCFGEVATKVDGLDPEERRRLLLEALRTRFGPRAADPVEIIETPWWQQEWTRGCSMAHLPPGVLTRLGPLLRTPFGRVHWAGTETSTVSHGAIDGAIRSGERAVAEVLDR
jgi:monoamine oxidase